MTTKRAQISMEFMSLVVVGFFIAFGLLIAFSTLSSDRATQKAYLELQDLGRATQQELLLAGELENGYSRTFFIPDKVNSLDYTLTTGVAASFEHYFLLQFENQELFYGIPPINGTLQKGTNTVSKVNDTIYLT